ncbi:isopentenyl-diphosphate Delta-isomerase 1 [Diorhabda carinulata]|uniref:isopentenyl-diphosphate Delta-isomerase 1 n=1 Tax=Diorhabda carinulata TaxID=1163345 RepID=UPI0025A0238C|nr:isopentenyl-diphosphate Delta-isomerase 1 [Diorhabda carinulata]
MLSALRSSVNRTISKSFSTTLINTKEPLIDPTQAALLNEKCFLVDTNDNIIGQANKKECHLVQPNGDIPLHRAFSVFLFNKRGDLLLQKRSSHKVTYANTYTNSCCSHPIADYPEEAENVIGTKKAAIRRLNYELGIPKEQLHLDQLQYMTRILYKDEGDGVWGEHELDYVFILQSDLKIKPNSNEISEISYVPRAELDFFLKEMRDPFTPWFMIILKHRLRLWWDNLDRLEDFADHDKIYHFKK